MEGLFLTGDGSKARRPRFGLIVFALVTLFNPNVNVVDILPDFIGFYILAKFFSRFADIAPYFEEAATGLKRLFYLSLAKIPAFIVVGLAQSKNTMDNDIVALAAICFAAIELIVAIPTVRCAFDALFYLGQRSDATALIKDSGGAPVDALKEFTLLFYALKCILYSAPELLRLTRSVESGSQSMLVTGSNAYPWVLLFALALGFTVGGIWLSRVVRYAKRIKTEGLFYTAIASLITEATKEEYEEKKRRRSTFGAFTLYTLASLFSFDLIFNTFNDVNLFPRVISVILLMLSALMISRLGFFGRKYRISVITVGALSGAVSLVSYVMSIIFQTRYGYRALIGGEVSQAVDFYRTYIITAAAELILLLLLLWLTFPLLLSLTRSLKRTSGDLSRVDRDYRRQYTIKTLILTMLFSLSFISKFISALLWGNAQLIFTDKTDVTMPTVLAPAIPWFGIVTTALSVLTALYAFYYFSLLRDEIKENQLY